MADYTLYLDESETGDFNNFTGKLENKHFVISGIIVETNYHATILTKKISLLKNNLWNRCDDDSEYNNHILHELEMSRAITKKKKEIKCEYNKIFKNPHLYNIAYDTLANIFSDSDIFILGVCICEDNMNIHFNTQKLNDRMSIAMNMLIENYCHFLHSVNSTGNICYESMQEKQNLIISKRYKQIRNYGTMFYPAKSINKRITNLSFVNKFDNITGLQLADFVPNSLGRHVISKQYANKTQRNIPYSTLESKFYDGLMNNKERFGFKIIP